MDSDPDPTSSWGGVTITKKLTQGQKRALKSKRQVELGIPPRGFRGGKPSNWFTVIMNFSWQKKKSGSISDSTDYVSDDNPDPMLSVALQAQRTISETLVSQVPSLPSSGVPDHKQPIEFTPSPECEAMIALVDDLPLDDLGLVDEDEPKDDPTRM
jgi:hypothetical protein